MKKFPYSLEELETWKIDLIDAIWVGLIIKDNTWKVFLVLEKEEKAWKKPGQRSTVMETIESTDNCLLDAVKRWLKEELGIKVDKWEKIYLKDVLLNCYVYDSEKDKVYKVKVYLYEVTLTKEQSEEALKFTNWEVEKVKLVNLEDLKINKISPLRPGTKEVIFWYDRPFFIVDGEEAEGY